jgi:glyoxylase-like metal-dependent hydrolase (beta-lactamase superfamily II)
MMTHMHPDHAAGLIDSSGKAVFPMAELIPHENELAAEARKKVLKFVAGEKLRVAGAASTSRRLGGAAYRYVPEVWRPTT